MTKNRSGFFRKGPQGFTLIELLISASLITLLSTAVFSVLARGLDVWKRVRFMDRSEDLIRFSLESFAREVRTAFHFTPVRFAGDKGQVLFPTYVKVRGADGQVTERIAKVTYLYSPEAKALFRRQESYADLFHPDRAVFKKFMAPVEEAAFAYYAFNAGLKRYEWQETWSAPSRPMGVRLTLTVPDHKGGQKHVVKTIFSR